MALGDTARMIASLELKDSLTAGVKKATAALDGLTSKSTTSGRALSTLQGAANHTWGTLKGLAGAVGVVGLGGGLLALTSLMKSSIDETQKFGETVLQLHQFTGESAESLSTLAGAMVAQGLDSETASKSIGMMNKMLGQLGTQGELDFTKKYGIALRDLSGNFKSTNELVLEAADLYNNDLMPAEDKAAALTKMFGRGWQTLIPLLADGREGILDLEQSAKDMGLVITNENLPAIRANKDATDKWNQAVGGLKLQIGLKLLPAVTTLSTKLTEFVSGHQTQIVQFFGDAAKFAGDLGGVIVNDVVPALGTIVGWWNSIPGPLQQLLIGGLIVNKVTGVGPIDIAKIFAGSTGSSGGNVVTKALGLQQHVWVDNMPVGGMGGGGGVTGPASGGSVLSGASKAALGLGFVGAVVAGSAVIAEVINGIASDEEAKRQAKYKAAGLTAAEIAAIQYQMAPPNAAGNRYALKNPAPAGYEKDLASALAKLNAPTTAVEAAARAMADAPPKMAAAVGGAVAKFKPAPVNIDFDVTTTVSASAVTQTQTKIKRYHGGVAL
jgi:hypothetical protein